MLSLSVWQRCRLVPACTITLALLTVLGTNHQINCQTPSTGLYFTLNGVVHLPGDTVLITDIGVDIMADPNPGSSLVCNTSNVNDHCCRGQNNPNGGSLGDWYFPDGNIVPRPKDSPNSDFTRTGWTHEVRLNRRNNAMTPLGAYECRVPHMDTTNTEVHTATIIISAPPTTPAPTTPTTTATTAPPTTPSTSAPPPTTTTTPVTLPPTTPPPTTPPPTTPPPTTPPPTKELYFMLGTAQYHYRHGETLFLLSLDDAARQGPLICATNNVNPQCCRGGHNNNTDINDGCGIGEWYYNGTLVPTLDESGGGNLFRNRSLRQVHLNVEYGMILPAGIYRCVVPDTTGQNVSATITLTNEAPISTTVSSNVPTSNTPIGGGTGSQGGVVAAVIIIVVLALIVTVIVIIVIVIFTQKRRATKKTSQSALEMNTTAGSKGYDITANQAYGSVSAPRLYEEINNHGDVYTEIQPKEHGAATEGNFQLSECPAYVSTLATTDSTRGRSN